MSWSNDDIKPFEFINFDKIKNEKQMKELYRFNVKKEFTPEFEIEADEHNFIQMFQKGKIVTKEDYERQLKEYYEERKKEIDEQVEKYLKYKEEKAKKIIEEAEKEAEDIRKKAYDEAYQKGYEEGVEQGKKESIEKYKENFEYLKNIIFSLQNFEQKILLENYPKIASLIVKFAEKIIKKEIEQNHKEILLNNIKHILERIIDKGFIHIKVSKDEFEFLQENMEELKDIFSLEKVEIIPSEQITKGSCIIDTNYGTYDARIEEQIKELKEELL